MANKESTQSLKCSFCGKSQKQVIKLIEKPSPEEIKKIMEEKEKAEAANVPPK